MTEVPNLTMDCEPGYGTNSTVKTKGITTGDESDADNQMADKQKVSLSTAIYERVYVITRHPSSVQDNLAASTPCQ
jgi:hypothetical protein